MSRPSENYIDIKVTSWNRYYFEDTANMQKIIELLKEKDNPDRVVDNTLGFIESEMLQDSSEYITLEENGGQRTIEVYENDQEIWNNESKGNQETS